MKNKELKKLISLVGIVLLVSYLFLLIKNDGVLLFWGDGADQYLQITSYTYENIRNGTLRFWEPSFVLGSNVFTLFFYTLGSPSFYLMLLTPSKEYLVYSIAIVNVIRFFVVSVFAYKWLSKLIDNSDARIITSVAFTFCGYAMFWLHLTYYMDVLIYLPLILYISEEMLQNNRKYISFSIVIALIGILSVYQLYMITWFIFIYVLCRYFMINSKFEFKYFVSSFFKFLFHYILGISLASIIIIPTLSILLHTNRINTSNEIFTMINFKDIVRSIFSLVSPVLNDYDYNVYLSVVSNGTSNGNTVYAFITMLFPLLLSQLYFIKFKGKKVFISFFIFLYASLLFKVFYFVFNGNFSIRWTFFFSVFNCMALAYILDKKEDWNFKVLNLSFVFVLVSMFTMVFISRYFNLLSTLTRQSQKYVIPMLFIILIIQYISLIKKENRLLFLAIIIESLTSLFVRVYNENRFQIANGKEIWYYKSLIYHSDIMSKINSLNDEDFYRMEIKDVSNLNYNIPLSDNYAGFSAYSSIYNYYSDEFISKRFGTKWYFGYQPSKFLIKNLLGNKYLVLNNNDSDIPYAYSKIYENDSKSIYENENFINLGYGSNRVVNIKEIEDLPIFMQDYIMNQAIVTDGKTTYEYEILENIKLSDAKSFKPLEYENGEYYIDYSKDDITSYCRYELYENDNFEELNKYEISYQSLKLDKNYNDVFIYCSSENNPNHYPKINLYWLSNENIDKLNKLDKDLFTNVKNYKDKIYADINISSDNEIVTTNVTYDKGWKVYDNGKEIEIIKTNIAFIGFKLDKGNHNIKMVYKPIGFEIGKYISISSLVFMITYIVYKKRFHS